MTRRDGSGGGSRIAQRAARIRGDVILGLLDSLAVVLAYACVLVLRFDGTVPQLYWDRFWRSIPYLLVAHLGVNRAWGLYRPMWRHASVQEARRVVAAGASAGTVLVALHFWLDGRLPLSVVLLGPVGATLGMGVVRFQSRLFAFQRGRQRTTGIGVIVIGAGEAGAAITREMLRQPASGLVPLAFVDDDTRKHGRSIVGVPVAGSIDALPEVVRAFKPGQVLFAIPSAGPDLLNRVADLLDPLGVTLKVLPAVHDLLGGRPRVRDVRDLRIEDLLGRSEVVTDLDGVGQLLAGRKVLITGAGGSIGSEIARQVESLGPARIVLLDHDETHLHDVAATLESAVQVLADIRDPAVVAETFIRHRPDVVFHAAAHKHVPLLEAHPCEAVLTNIVGTANVTAAAAEAGVTNLVYISTDKAVAPASVMGASKRVGEDLVLARAPAGASWCAVRFGNVLGSRGSVIPTFARQIAAGGPVTVTDRRMTRFFMSTEEAVQLVLQAATFSRGGEIFMLEMGEPVNILDLAERMIRLSGYSVGTDIAIEFTGVRPGEKLVEQLRSPDEAVHPTPHASIVRLEVTPRDVIVLDVEIAALVRAARAGDGRAAREQLAEIVRGAPQLDPLEWGGLGG